MAKLRCPEEHELMPLVAGELVPDSISSHVDRCDSCQLRLKRLRGEISSLRWALDSSSAETLALLRGDGNELGPATDGIASPLSRDNGSSVARTLPPSGDANDEPLPAQIGRYRVIARLGRGGQAVVFRVVHPNLEKDLVLKLSRQELDPRDPQHDRLVLEGKRLAELDHPNMARIVDLDFYQRRAFLVMEYVRGRSLRQHARQRPLNPLEAARLVAQIARGLSPAHAIGMIHRDIKPDNILIDETGRPRIIDFGMALLRGAWVDDSDDPGTIGGSVAYMAPEQARGETDRLDVHSDVFSLGAVLYELLIGKPPFHGNNLQDLLHRAQHCDYDRDVLRRPGIPSRLAAVCVKAMSPEPASRHANVEVLAAELDRIADTRRRSILLCSLLGLLMMIVVCVFLIRRASRVPDEPLQDLVQIQQGEQPFSTIYKAGPIKSFDNIQIQCEVPAGWKASMFWLNSSGLVQQISPSQVGYSPRTASLFLVYPKDTAFEIRPPSGTELVLICAHPRSPPSEKIVAEAFSELNLLEPWPPLPKLTVVAMNHQRVEQRRIRPEVNLRDLGPETENAAAKVTSFLDQLRQRLNKPSPFLAGLAFRHTD